MLHAVFAAAALSLGLAAATPPAKPGPAPAAEPAAATGLLGAWNGTIQVQTVQLRIAATFTGDAAKPSGTMDIPQQGARGIPLSTITIEGDEVSFALAGVPGDPTFRGTLKGDEITGTFKQSGAAFPFMLTRGEAPKAVRPQNPRPPFPYTEESLTTNNGRSVKLAGTLTRPPGDGPFPAVILISGSGPQNRDEELFEHRPFAVLADHLSRAGIIVLRYDDRGVGESTGDANAATITDFAADAAAWIPVLKARKDVSKVGLIGHSEGGIIAPMVAANDKDVGFIVLLAGPGVNGGEILVEQNRALAKAGGATDEAAAAISAAAKGVFDALATNAPEPELRDRVRALIAAQAGGNAAPEAEINREIDRQLQFLRSPWFHEFLTLNPAANLFRVSVPVLAINGEKDVQVVHTQNLPKIEEALRAGKNPDFTVRALPGLNHLFQPCTTGGVDEYERIELTIDPAALDLVRDWITSRFGKK